MTSSQRRQLQAAAQHLRPAVWVGRQGLTSAVLQSVVEALAERELVKVKFIHFREEREALAAELARRSGSDVVTVIGHVAVLFRPRAESKR
jgi:RNA-binding protein